MSTCKHLSSDGLSLCLLYGGPDCRQICPQGPCEDFAPLTIGDRIRRATDEELSEFLCDLRTKVSYDGCTGCPAYDFCEPGHTGFIDWLKKEAET